MLRQAQAPGPLVAEKTVGVQGPAEEQTEVGLGQKMTPEEAGQVLARGARPPFHTEPGDGA